MSGSRASSFGRFGRSDWSAKLIRGLRSKTAAGFRSRRGRCHEPTPVPPHYASFASYKTAGVHCGARRRGWVAARCHDATADEADQWPRHRVISGFLDSRFSIWSVDSPSQTALPAILYVPLIGFGSSGFLAMRQVLTAQRALVACGRRADEDPALDRRSGGAGEQVNPLLRGARWVAAIDGHFAHQCVCQTVRHHVPGAARVRGSCSRSPCCFARVWRRSRHLPRDHQAEAADVEER
jgi:hypothetical protein